MPVALTHPGTLRRLQMNDSGPKLQREPQAHPTAVGWAVRLVTALSAVALSVLLATTFTGVVMRYVFSSPILGVNEIVQLASVALVMLGMSAAAEREDHIRVDVLDRSIGRYGRYAGDLFARLVSIGVLAALAWRSWVKLLDAAEFGDETNMLGIPLWPFYGLIILGMVLYLIVLATQAFAIMRRGPTEHA